MGRTPHAALLAGVVLLGVGRFGPLALEASVGLSARLTFACLAAVAMPTAAQVYVGASSNGSVVLSNFASPDAPNMLIPEGEAPVVQPPPPGVEAASPVTRDRDIGAIVLRVAQELELPAQLLHAVIAVESAYDPRAVSPKGAQGLMQLMPATARRFGVKDPFDPQDNVRGGAQYLKVLLAQFNGDLQLALAAYNAGEKAVVRYGNRVPPFAETRRYVPKVMARMQRELRS